MSSVPRASPAVAYSELGLVLEFTNTTAAEAAGSMFSLGFQLSVSMADTTQPLKLQVCYFEEGDMVL